MASGRRIPSWTRTVTSNLIPSIAFEGEIGSTAKPYSKISAGTITGSLVLSRQKLVASGAFEGKDGARITGSFNHSGSTPPNLRVGLRITGSFNHSGSTPPNLKSGLRITGSLNHSGSTPPNLKSGLRITGSFSHSGSTPPNLKSGLRITGSLGSGGGLIVVTGSLYVSGSIRFKPMHPILTSAPDGTLCVSGSGTGVKLYFRRNSAWVSGSNWAV